MEGLIHTAWVAAKPTSWRKPVAICTAPAVPRPPVRSILKRTTSSGSTAPVPCLRYSNTWPLPYPTEVPQVLFGALMVIPFISSPPLGIIVRADVTVFTVVPLFIPMPLVVAFTKNVPVSTSKSPSD